MGTVTFEFNPITGQLDMVGQVTDVVDVENVLLLESGDYLLTETGGYWLLESA